MTLERQLRVSLIHIELLRLADVADDAEARILRYAAGVLRLLAERRSRGTAR